MAFDLFPSLSRLVFAYSGSLRIDAFLPEVSPLPLKGPEGLKQEKRELNINRGFLLSSLP